MTKCNYWFTSCFRVDSVDSDCTRHYGCVPLEGAGRACMYANSGARERAFNLRKLFRGSTAQKTSAAYDHIFTRACISRMSFAYVVFPKPVRKHFRRNFRKCLRMRPNSINYLLTEREVMLGYIKL